MDGFRVQGSMSFCVLQFKRLRVHRAGRFRV